MIDRLEVLVKAPPSFPGAQKSSIHHGGDQEENCGPEDGDGPGE